MSPKIGSQTPSVKTLTPAVKTQKAVETKPAEAKKPAADTGFADAAKKKGPNMTGRHRPVGKAPVPVKKDLTVDVAKLRSAAQAGSVSKAKVDPEVKSALELIKLNSYKGKDAVGDVLKELEPSVAKEVIKQLPPQARAEIAQSTPFGFQPISVRMAQVQNMTDAQLQDIGNSMRAGLVEDLGLQLAVSTELAARSQWGKDHPEIVDYQRQLVIDGKVNFKEGRGSGHTDVGGEVKLDPDLSKSPEALAATLAHEATHSYNDANGGMNASVYAEETAGNMASAQVWGELGNKDDPNLSVEKRDTLNEYARLYKSDGEDGVQSRAAAEYAAEAAKAADEHAGKSSDLKGAGKPKAAERESTKANEEAAKVIDVVNSLGGDRGAVKAMDGVYAFEIARATFKVGGDADIEKLAKAFKDLSPAAKKDMLQRLESWKGFEGAKETFKKALG